MKPVDTEAVLDKLETASAIEKRRKILKAAEQDNERAAQRAIARFNERRGTVTHGRDGIATGPIKLRAVSERGMDYWLVVKVGSGAGDRDRSIIRFGMAMKELPEGFEPERGWTVEYEAASDGTNLRCIWTDFESGDDPALKGLDAADNSGLDAAETHIAAMNESLTAVSLALENQVLNPPAAKS